MANDQPNISHDGAQANAFQRYFREARQRGSSSPVRRPWLLATLALTCAGLAVAGSLGPWMYHERVSKTAPDSWTLYGARTDGAFTLFFAAIAIMALLIALFWRGDDAVAWVAFGALILCALTGLLNWFMFAPPETSVNPGEQGNIVRVEWGIKLVALAGTVGAFLTYLVARRLYRD